MTCFHCASFGRVPSAKKERGRVRLSLQSFTPTSTPLSVRKRISVLSFTQCFLILQMYLSLWSRLREGWSGLFELLYEALAE
jgi:hypothetical protein